MIQIHYKLSVMGAIVKRQMVWLTQANRIEEEHMKETIRYLRDVEVSEITGIALSTLRNRRCTNRPPAYLKVGRSVRYRPDDISKFMEGNRVTPRNE